MCTTYDTRGRVTKVAYPAVNGATARTVTTSYAVGGNPLVTSESDSSGTITTITDLLGRTKVYTDAKGVTTTTGYTTRPAGTSPMPPPAAGRPRR
jgi:hypothetical protein